MKKITLPLLFLLIVVSVQAQQKSRFSSQTYAGLIVGETYSDLQVQTINGIKWNKWFGGIGTGIDWHYFRTVPVFASVNRDLLKKGKNTLLVTADAGINLPWKKSDLFYDAYVTDTKLKGGLYWGAGIGYRFEVGKNTNALQMNFGYSFKQSKEEIINVYPCLSPPCNPVTDVFEYRLNRLSIRLGWIF